MKWVVIVPICVLVAAGVAFFLEGNKKPRGYGDSTYGPIEFKDDVQTNTDVTAEALDLAFTDLKGNTVRLADFRDKQNVVLVFTRGFPGYVCPHCSAQTSRLIAQKDEFANRNAAVLVVFPGPKEHVQEFISSSEHQAQERSSRTMPLPFPVLLDIDYKAVDQLGLRDDLAKPSTYILDKHGELRFAYVGANSADRPSVKAMLAQLDAMESDSN